VRLAGDGRERLGRAVHEARALAAKPRGWAMPADIRSLPPEAFVRVAYQAILRRDPDPAGLRNYVDHLRHRTRTHEQVLDELLTSTELRFHVPYLDSLRSLHLSRCDLVRMLPKARRILDLGGTDLDDPRGALVGMGYPYDFERLVIVDLPHGERHELYGRGERLERVQTERGPVEYVYRSMTDLDGFADGSFDLVWMGQSIEHVTEDAADRVFVDVRRVLAPGGWFCLDTPNGRACRVQMEELTNPDHEIEYTHEELSGKLERAGYDIRAALGLALVRRSIATGVWDPAELAANHGVYADIRDCYALAYLCTVQDGATAIGGPTT
jgi:SAM-dependent methyltransferase